MDCFVALNPNSIRGGGKIGHTTQNLVKRARVRTIIIIYALLQISLFDTALGKPQKISFLVVWPLRGGGDKAGPQRKKYYF